MAKPIFAFPADLEESSSGTVIVSFPDLPEALTEGTDMAEAISRAADCLEEAIAARMVNREDIPEPSRNRAGKFIVMLPAATAAKAALYVAMREAGISNVALGRRIGVDERQIRRLIDPRYRSNLADIDRALMSLDRRLEIELGPIVTDAFKSRGAEKILKAPTRRTLVRKTALKRKTPLKRKTTLRKKPVRDKTK
ncbi:MAG: type II toxin-antitoxin system HicB family antitoxin [Proteobacteria bacterium]|nr:type II toxin-antitoxin system HicB family antitoxin [Pseudomonadota bacterium]